MHTFDFGYGLTSCFQRLTGDTCFIRRQVMKEEQAASRKKASEVHKMEVYLAAELEQTTCPICYEVMQPPEHTPTLLFPCGHTFCKGCLEGHVKANNRRTCPYCREKIQSQAPNMILQQLIDGFTTQKKAQAAAGKRDKFCRNTRIAAL